MNTLKIWYSRIIRSKTMLVALAISIGGVIQAQSDFLKTVLTPDTFGYVMLAIGIVMAALRVVTVTALVDK